MAHQKTPRYLMPTLASARKASIKHEEIRQKGLTQQKKNSATSHTACTNSQPRSSKSTFTFDFDTERPTTKRQKEHYSVAISNNSPHTNSTNNKSSRSKSSYPLDSLSKRHEAHQNDNIVYDDFHSDKNGRDRNTHPKKIAPNFVGICQRRDDNLRGKSQPVVHKRSWKHDAFTHTPCESPGWFECTEDNAFDMGLMKRHIAKRKDATETKTTGSEIPKSNFSPVVSSGIAKTHGRSYFHSESPEETTSNTDSLSPRIQFISENRYDRTGNCSPVQKASDKDIGKTNTTIPWQDNVTIESKSNDHIVSGDDAAKTDSSQEKSSVNISKDRKVTRERVATKSDTLADKPVVNKKGHPKDRGVPACSLLDKHNAARMLKRNTELKSIRPGDEKGNISAYNETDMKNIKDVADSDHSLARRQYSFIAGRDEDEGGFELTVIKYDHRQINWEKTERDHIAGNSSNLQFYQNEKKSETFWGYKIEDMLKWKGDYDTLERNHSYIQWLFPTQEPSNVNSYAKPVQFHEAEQIRDTPVLKSRFLRAYEMMLDFYGMELKSKETGEVGRCWKNWEKRFSHLNRSPHNYRRITRILIALGIFGYGHYQTPWISFMLSEIYYHKTLTGISEGPIYHWIGSINDGDARKAVLMELCQLTSKN